MSRSVRTQTKTFDDPYEKSPFNSVEFDYRFARIKTSITPDNLPTYAATDIVKSQFDETDRMLTERIRAVATKLTPVINPAALRLSPLASYADKVAAKFPRGARVDYALESEPLSTELTARLSRVLYDGTDFSYDQLCLLNAKKSKSTVEGQLLHHDGSMLVEEFYDPRFEDIVCEVFTAYFSERLNDSVTQDDMSPVNSKKGIGFYRFHPDGQPVTQKDLYLPVPDSLGKYLKGKRYDTNSLFARKDSSFLRHEWCTSSRLKEILRFFAEHDYVNPSHLDTAYSIGAAMVSIVGERRNQVDTWKNKDVFDKIIGFSSKSSGMWAREALMPWYLSAYHKDRWASYEYRPYLNYTFKVHNRRLNEALRQDYRSIGKEELALGPDSRARRVYQQSLILGPTLNSLARFLYHRVEVSPTGFPSTNEEWLKGINDACRPFIEQGYSIYILNMDNPNSEQKVTDCSQHLRACLPECFRRIHDNATTSILPSYYFALVLYLALASGGPFTTSDNMTFGCITVPNVLKKFFSLSADFYQLFRDVMVNMIIKRDPLKVFPLRSPLFSNTLWVPRLGTDNQPVVLLTKEGEKLEKRFEELKDWFEAMYIDAELVRVTTQFAVCFDGLAGSFYPQEMDSQYGKFCYFERSIPSIAMDLKMAHRARTFLGDKFDDVSSIYFDLCGVGLEGFLDPQIEQDFKVYQSLIGYDVQDLGINPYSNKDLHAYGDLINMVATESGWYRFSNESDIDFYRRVVEGQRYPVEEMGPNVELLLNYMRRG